MDDATNESRATFIAVPREPLHAAMTDDERHAMRVALDVHLNRPFAIAHAMAAAAQERSTPRPRHRGSISECDGSACAPIPHTFGGPDVALPAYFAT